MYSYDVLVDRDSGRTETITEPLYDIFVRRALTDGDWGELAAHCRKLGLGFIATLGDDETLALAVKIGVQSLKIASADINHFPFLRQAARTGLSIQLDTGSASFGEIEAAVDLIRAEGNDQILIHNCPTGYPARIESINLRMIPALKQLFACPAAFSDHTPGWDMDIAAVALGADLVEKTITEDRTTRSVEHLMSLEPPEMARFVQAIRDVEKALGQPRRMLSDAEKQSRVRVRRSIHLASPVTAGTRLADAAVRFQRPGFGVTPDSYETMGEYRFRRDMPAGARVNPGDLEAPPEPSR
jgi:sialic acid synthase SpsE